MDKESFDLQTVPKKGKYLQFSRREEVKNLGFGPEVDAKNPGWEHYRKSPEKVEGAKKISSGKVVPVKDMQTLSNLKPYSKNSHRDLPSGEMGKSRG